jgi:hypothetical protein
MKLSKVSVCCSLLMARDHLSLETDESLMTGYGIQINSVWFQHDGVRPHTSNIVFYFNHYTFEKDIQLNLVLFEEGFSWPLN